MKNSRTIVTLMYIMIVLYFAIFNWDLFTVTLNIDIGFTLIQMPIFIVLFSISFIFILLQLAMGIINNMQTERHIAQKDYEIMNLKAEQYGNQLSEVRKNAMSLKELHNKINKLNAKIYADSAVKDKLELSSESISDPTDDQESDQ
ncbi:MAG: hypothetical protein GF313_02530 [Caldithrix sp.]|nr:hypothetical protein [Caldithrix sp.]